MNWDLLLSRSYSPYSHKPAACLVQGHSGSYYPGVRIENISFPLTMADDQIAICFCLSEGDKPKKLILKPGDDTDRTYWVSHYNLITEHHEHIEDMPCQSHLLEKDINIPQELDRLAQLAVTPNSNFNVSALLETSRGYVQGVNVELDDWQKGLCAERLALAKAFCLGLNPFISLHVYADADFISPCGACRQVLIEHLPHNPVSLYNRKGTKSFYFTDHLLPFHMKSLSFKI